MKTRLTAWALALLIAGSASIVLDAAADPVPDFTLPSATDDSLVRLSDYSGQVVLLSFWRTTCAYCRREMPALVKLYGKYHGKGLEVIGIADEDPQTVDDVGAFKKEYGMTWPVGLNDQGELRRNVIAKGSGDTPSHYLVSRDGTLTFLGTIRSTDDWKKVEAAIQKALAQPKPAKPAIVPAPMPKAGSFELAGADGKKVSSKVLEGKPALLYFFGKSSGSWGGAAVTKVHEKYGPRGLQVVGIQLYGDEKSVTRYVEQYHAKYPVLIGDQTTQTAWLQNKGWGAVFITADGKVAKKIVDSVDGGIEEAVFSRYAEYLLKPVPSP